MANFVVTKIDSIIPLGVFSNLKNAVSCLEEVTEKASYTPIYRKMRTLENGDYIDIEGYRLSKLLINQAHKKI